MIAPRPDDLDIAVTSGAVTALRKLAARLRRRAAPSITVLDGPPMTIVRTSEAAPRRINPTASRRRGHHERQTSPRTSRKR